MQQIKYILSRLKKPKVILSIVSQLISLLLLFGFNVNESLIMSAATIGCSILAAVGIMSNPDTETKGYGDDFLFCSACGNAEPHIKVNGQMVCKRCGEVHCENIDE